MALCSSCLRDLCAQRTCAGNHWHWKWQTVPVHTVPVAHCFARSRWPFAGDDNRPHRMRRLLYGTLAGAMNSLERGLAFCRWGLSRGSGTIWRLMRVSGVPWPVLVWVICSVRPSPHIGHTCITHPRTTQTGADSATIWHALHSLMPWHCIFPRQSSSMLPSHSCRSTEP